MTPILPSVGCMNEGRHRRCRRTPAEWREQKQAIFDLYIKNNKSVDEVVNALGAVNFRTSRRQLLNKLKEWKFVKNFSQRHWGAIRRIQARRMHQGKDTSFRVNGTPVSTERIKRYVNGHSNTGFEAPESLEAPTPSEINYFTPDDDRDTIMSGQSTPRTPAQLPSCLSPMNHVLQHEEPNTELWVYDEDHDTTMPRQSTPGAMLRRPFSPSPIYYPWAHPEATQDLSDLMRPISHQSPLWSGFEEPSMANGIQKPLPKLFVDLPFLELANLHRIELLERSRLLSPSPVPMDVLLESEEASVLPAHYHKPLEVLLAMWPDRHAGKNSSSLFLSLSRFLPKGYMEEFLAQDTKILVKTRNGPVQVIFNLATYFFSNSLFSEKQEDAFIKWLISEMHIESLKEFLKFPTSSIRVFGSKLLAATHRCREMHLWRQLVEAGIHSDDIAKQAVDLGCENYLISVLKKLHPVKLGGKPGGLLLRKIASTEQVKAAEFLIERGADVDLALSQTGAPTTALYEAIKNDNYEMTKLLLDNGANVKRVGLLGSRETYLTLALLKKKLTNIIKLLLDHGVKVMVDDLDKVSKEAHLVSLLQQYYPGPASVSTKEIMSAADSSEAGWQEFLKQHANISANDLESALSMAADKTKVRAVANLLRHGVNPNCPHIGKTLLLEIDFSSSSYTTGPGGLCLDLLIHYGIDINCDGIISFLAGQFLDVNVHFLRILERLLKAGLDPKTQGVLGLEDACLYQFDPIASILLDAGTPINSYGNLFTPVQAAATCGDLSLVKTLVQHGADIHKPAYEVRGLTALQAAAFSGSIELMKYLIGEKADVNSPPAILKGLTPLEAVVRPCTDWWDDDMGEYYEDRVDDLMGAFQFLLSQGANVNRGDGTSSPLLHDIIEHEHLDLLRCALDNGANVEYYWGTESSAGNDRTPLQLAAEMGELEFVQMLLGHGADPNSTAARVHGRTALQAAASSESPNEDIVQLLINKGAQMDTPPAAVGGITALQGAAIRGHINIALLLIENGADVNASPAVKDGRTAIEGAAEHGRLDMVKMLLNAGATGDIMGGTRFKNAIKLAKDNGHSEVVRLLEELW
ncbi:ankyrin repeat-containing domain protein [Xylaria digitata]|nr:ankyrin repeat-containing domain protein [Xylaria digitata]